MRSQLQRFRAVQFLTQRRYLSTEGSLSPWIDVPLGAPDAILGLNEAFKKDNNSSKMNLGVGAYRDDSGCPYVLPSVRTAEEIIMKKQLNHEYAGIAGVPEFVSLALEFAYGKQCSVLQSGRVAGIQSLSGTGALRIAGQFFQRFLGTGASIYVPNPTWGNHIPIMKDSGLVVERYRYLDDKGTGLDYTGMLSDIKLMPDRSIILLHACAHNPTGVDPNEHQWREISSVIKNKNHVVLMDCAYQGFASGNADKDAFSIRQFVADGHTLCLAQSFAKNFGLYGERVGALSIIGESSREAERILSQLKIIARPMYSNPPIYGARIVSTILGDAVLEKQWYNECKGMAKRIIGMRLNLKESLYSHGSLLDWEHVTSQIGMFCYTGLSKPQVEALRNDYHIYLTGDGRISMAGVTSGNVEYLANAIHEVTKTN